MGWLARLFCIGKDKSKPKKKVSKMVRDIPEEDDQEQYLIEPISVPERVAAMNIKPGAAKTALEKRDKAAEKKKAKDEVQSAQKQTSSTKKESEKKEIIIPREKVIVYGNGKKQNPDEKIHTTNQISAKESEVKPIAINQPSNAAATAVEKDNGEAKKPIANAVKAEAIVKSEAKPIGAVKNNAEAKKPIANAVKAEPIVKSEAKPIGAVKNNAEAKKPMANAVKAEPVVKSEAKPIGAVKNNAEAKKPIANAVKAEAIAKSEAKPIGAVKNNAEAKKPVANAVKAEATPQKDESETIVAEETVKVIESKSGKSGKFDIKKSKDGRYVFNLYASNHVIVATSQIYTSSQSAIGGIKSIIANAKRAAIEDQTLKNYSTVPYPKWEMYVDKGGQYRFRLNAPNGSCIVHSQGYTTKSACKKGIDSIIRIAEDSEIDKSYLKATEDK